MNRVEFIENPSQIIKAMAAVSFGSGQGGMLLSQNGTEQETWKVENPASLGSHRSHEFSLSVNSKVLVALIKPQRNGLLGSSTIMTGLQSSLLKVWMIALLVRPAHGKGGNKCEAWTGELA